MTRRTIAASIGLAALVLAACGDASTVPPAGAHQGRALVEESNTGVTFTQDFNPFNPGSMAHKLNLSTLMYEPLYEIDQLDVSQQHPWLASAYTWQNGGKDLQITVKSGIQFSDGTALTPNDVAATYKAIKDIPAANYSGMPSQSADPTVSGNAVTLHYAQPEYSSLYTIIGNTFIVPAALVTQLGTNLATGAVAHPVGTGPFQLGSFSSQVIKFTPNAHYWDGTPPEPEIDVPAFATNNAASQALASGQLDWAGNDIANVYQNYVNLDPEHNHAWFASGNTVTLWFNVKYGVLGDPAVRKAISYGINRNALSQLGESGYEYPAISSSGLILPNDKGVLDSSLANDLPPVDMPNSAAAQAASPAWTGPTVESILTADGWSGWKSGGGGCTGSGTNCWTKNGQIITFAIEDPVPYSDYWECAQLISQELQSEGIDATTLGDNPDSNWYTHYQSGNFQAMIHWGAGGPTPYVQYQNWLDSTQPTAAGDYGGYKNDAAQAALQTLASTDPSNSSAYTQSVQALEKIVSDDVPVAPLLYGADWNVYSSAHYSGWPDASHPYMDPAPNDPELPYILMHLKPVA